MKRYLLLCSGAAILATVSVASPGFITTLEQPGLKQALDAYGQARLDEAEDMFHAVALQGSPVAETMLGVIHGTARAEKPADPVSSALWYYRAAQKGYPQGQLMFGLLRAKGQGVAQDQEDALTWLLLASKVGDPAIAATAANEARALASSLPEATVQAATAAALDWRPIRPVTR
jgi:uncharacterized protein